MIMITKSNPFSTYAVLPDLSKAVRTPQFVVDRLIDRDSLNVLVAAPSCGKTALSFLLAKCLTTGEQFLGMDTRVLGRCAFLQFDMSERQQVMYNNIFAPECPIRYVIGNTVDAVRNPINLMEPDTINNLIDWCKDDCIEVLFVDTLSTAFAGTDENSNVTMTLVMRVLRSIAQSGVTVIALHHVSKGEYGYSTSTRGASAIEGCADNVIKLVEGSGGVEVRVTKSRCTTKGVKAMYRFENNAITLVDKEQQKYSNDQLRLLACFETAEELSRKQIQELTRFSPNKLQDVLETACKEQILSKEKRNRADVYVKFVEPETVPEP